VADLRAPLPPPATDAERIGGPEAAPAAPPSPPLLTGPEPMPHRPGQLSAGWRLIMVVAWVGVVLAWSAVWNASVQLGRPTWWLGTRADPMPVVVRLAPFAVPVVLILGALRNARWLAWTGVAGAIVFGGYAVADLSNEPDLAMLEIGVATAGLVVSLLALTGTYRRDSH
jgi:hypothetical protein